MRTITEQKPLPEILDSLKNHKKIYIAGCGTCATMCHTGGKAEVLAMKKALEGAGKEVTGWMVIPTACDILTKYAVIESADRINTADAVLSMSCGLGVQTIAFFVKKPVYPALNTLFMGWEERPGHFIEMCAQCGDCVVGITTGICPMTRCAKSILSGSCGGAKNGKCEQQPEHDCAWVLIYDRLKELGMLEKLKEIPEPKNYAKMKIPRQADIV